MFLRQSTSQAVRIGPFLDSTNGVSPEAGLTIANTDIQLSKDGGSFGNKASGGATADGANGWYSMTFGTGDSDTVGELIAEVTVAGALPVWFRWWVLEESIYDALFGASAAGFDGSQRVDVGSWLGTAVTTSSTSTKPQVDLFSVSDDATAANNLESQYDTSGLAGDTFPATQSQIGNLSTGSAAINTIAASFTKNAGEPETNTYTATVALDGVYHIVEDDAPNTSAYYEFNVGANGVPISVQWDGYAQSNGDEYTINAYNWAGTAWQQVGTVEGKNGTTPVQEIWTLTTGHVGTSGDAGKVRLQFVSTDGTAFATDRILCAFAVVAPTVGYATGAIWYDDTAGNTNTTPFIDGVADNPVSTWAAVKTLSASTGIKQIKIANDSSVTLDADTSKWSLFGTSWNLNLGSQTIANIYVEGAVVATSSGTGTRTKFRDCHMEDVTIDNDAELTKCGFRGTITLNTAGNYFLDECRSEVAALATPSIDFQDANENKSLNMRAYSGGIEIKNFGQASSTDQMSLEGHGQLVLASTCESGTIAIRGHFTITDNVGGGFGGTISDEARYEVQQITGGAYPLNTTGSGNIGIDWANIENKTAVVALTNTSVDLALTSLVAVADAVWDELKHGHKTKNSMAVVVQQGGGGAEVTIRSNTAQAGSANTITLDVGASAIDNVYGGNVITITDGTGVGQTRKIVSYDGGTKVAIVDRDWVTNPANDSDFDITAFTGSVISDEGVAQAGASTSITLASTASVNNDIYNGSFVTITSGTGSGQTRSITDYDGGTKVADVDSSWSVDPDNTSAYAVTPSGADVSDSGGGTAAPTASENAIAVWVDTLASYTGAGTTGKALSDIEDDTGELQTNQGNWLTATSVTVTAATAGFFEDFFTVDSGKVSGNEVSGSMILETAKIVWDRVLTGGTHNITNSAGRRLREAAQTTVITSGTAQGPGVNDNQIQLASGASSVNGAYDPALVVIVAGTGEGQTRLILEYKGSNRTATVDRGWKINPAGDSEYIIVPDAGREHVNEGLARAGTSTTIKLNALASSEDNAYLGQTILIRSGTGEDQARVILAYDGSTKIATVHTAWGITPDTTSAYVMHLVGNVRVVDHVASAKEGYKLASDGLDLVLIDGETLPDALQIIGAVVAGQITTAGEATEIFLGLDGVTTRVSATVDSSGNRSNVSYS